MHLAVVAGAMSEVVQFLNVQGVHIGAQADGAAGCVAVAVQHADHPRGSETAVHLNAEFGQLFGHEFRGPLFLEGGLRMGMEVAAPALDLLVELGDTVDDGHGGSFQKCFRLAARHRRDVWPPLVDSRNDRAGYHGCRIKTVGGQQTGLSKPPRAVSGPTRSWLGLHERCS